MPGWEGRARETPARPYLPSSRRAGIIDASSRPCSPMVRTRGTFQPRRGGLLASPQLSLVKKRGARRGLAGPKTPPGSRGRSALQARVLFRVGLEGAGQGAEQGRGALRSNFQRGGVLSRESSAGEIRESFGFLRSCSVTHSQPERLR